MKTKKQTVPPVKAANLCPTKSAGALPVDLYGAGRPLPDFNPSGPIPFTVPAVNPAIDNPTPLPWNGITENTRDPLELDDDAPPHPSELGNPFENEGGENE